MFTDGASTTSLGKLCQCPVTLAVKRVFRQCSDRCTCISLPLLLPHIQHLGATLKLWQMLLLERRLHLGQSIRPNWEQHLLFISKELKTKIRQSSCCVHDHLLKEPWRYLGCTDSTRTAWLLSTTIKQAPKPMPGLAFVNWHLKKTQRY